MPKHTKPEAPRRSAAEWRKIVSRWTRSGQSADIFAEKHHLSKGTLIWWRWRLRAGSTGPSRSSTGPELAFVPLVASSAPPSSKPPAEACWVLETAAGIRVEMSGSTALLVDGLGIALERVGGKA